MSKLPARRSIFGSLQLFYVLIAFFLVAATFVVASGGIHKSDTAVLSESESGGSSGSSHGGDSNTSGSSGSTSGTSGETRTESPKPTGTTTLQIRARETAEPEVENEQEVEIPELEDENEFEVEEGTETAKIRLGKREDKFIFFEQRFGAESSFPVSVNRTTRELTINTPAGIRTVAILPDSAVENMIAAGVIDRVVGANGQIVQIKVGEDGNIEYEIIGARDARLLGLFNVAIPRTVNVSAQTGNLVGVNESFFSQLLDVLSI